MKNGRKIRAVLGLATVVLAWAGCDDHRNAGDDAKQAGRELGQAARKASDAVKDVAEGFKEGVGGSGHSDVGNPMSWDGGTAR